MSKRIFSFFFLFLFLSTLFLSFPSSIRGDDGDGDSESNDEDVDVDVSDAGDGGATAAETEASETVETESAEGVLKSSDDIATRFYFPQSAERSFVVGEEIVLLVGIANSGQQAYNLTYLYANLRSPMDFNYLIQNYSALPIHTVLEGGKEISLAYRFRPDANLEPLEFRVESFIDYSLVDSSDSVFRSSVFNSSITLLERRSEFNAQTFFQYLLFAAVAGVVVYVLAGQAGLSGGKKKSKSAAAVEKNNVEWTVEEYKPAEKSKAVKRSRSSKK